MGSNKPFSSINAKIVSANESCSSSGNWRALAMACSSSLVMRRDWQISATALGHGSYRIGYKPDVAARNPSAPRGSVMGFAGAQPILREEGRSVGPSADPAKRGQSLQGLAVLGDIEPFDL